MAAPDTILRLVERFDANIAEYKDTSYLEAQLRVDFLNPMMQALGWDVTNAQGLAEHLRDVRSEDKVTVNEFEEYATKAPDYGFYTYGKRRFFLEAKKPSIFLFKDITPAFQLRRYAWSAKMPLSILTDFEEFAVYDCRVKPDKSDAAATARILYLTYTDYAEKWDSIAELFHKDAVLAGSLEKFAQTKVKKGSEPVDEAFLSDIERWRTSLAVDIARNNHALSERDINHAVQTTIDRIIFLRIAEDRAIEDYGQLLQAAAMNAVQESLLRLYHKADDTYNSGLFHLRHEKGRDDEGIDTITPRLKIDDAPLRSIINKLYFPESPYAFEMIPPEVLGQVYEQFLGKVIVLDARHTATVEEKPEVRKAGGVYYTPQYIVEYIVQNTVGKLLANCKNPKEADNISICDPACGSGSFLLGAYQFVLEWYAAWYTANSPEKHTKAVWNAAPKGEAAEWRLTIAEKKRILLNSFYGVDIDAQAVEVTKLSLMLKALEGESTQTLAAQRPLYKERLLPDLRDNIKCGNALIGTDFYSGKQFSAFDEEVRLKINAFDWDVEFASVMNRGGFDAVVGNPPYGGELSSFERTYLERKYAIGSTDTAALFMVKQLILLKKNGYGSFIVPKPFIYASNWKKTRTALLDKITEIVDCSKVWKTVKLEQVMYFVRKDIFTDNYTSCLRADKKIENVGTINKQLCEKFGFILGGVTTQEISVAEKLFEQQTFLGDYVNNQRGAMLQKLVRNKITDYLVWGGQQISRYDTPQSTKGHISATKINDEKAFVKPRSILVQNIVAHIQNPTDHIKIIATIVEEPSAIILDTVNQLENISQYDSRFLLGILNSKLINWYVYRFIFAKAIRTMHFDAPITNRIPIPQLDLAHKQDGSAHKNLVQLVSEMLALHKEQTATESAEARTHLERQIAGTDKRIDALVYALYGLTAEEIAVVEGQ
jgi:type I restriction-modification system DNA methylase subunit